MSDSTATADTEVDDRPIIDDETKAELIDRCVEGVLDLLNAKERYEKDGQTYAYELEDAVSELIDSNSELRDELAKVHDPSVRYDFVLEVVEKFDPTKADTVLRLPERIKEAMARDVAYDYARTSQSVKDVQEVRELIAEQLSR